MELEGKLERKFDERTGISQSSGNPWKIAGYVLHIPGMYEKRVALEVSDGQSGRIQQWDALIGQDVVVSFEINAREFQGKWFNSVRAYAIRPKYQQQQQQQQQAAPTYSQGNIPNLYGSAPM